MTRLPRVTATDLIRALRKAGFEVKRVRGSHHGVALISAAYLVGRTPRGVAGVLGLEHH